MSFSSPVLTLERDGHVATLWLDREEARNAMGVDLWKDLPRAAEAVAANSDIRVLIIAAKGPHFTVGLDLKQMGLGLGAGGEGASPAVKNKALYNSVRQMQWAITCFAELPIPVIAAVHGYCIGGGIDLITGCDIRVASADAIFSVRETKMAIVADLGTLQRLPRLVGPGVASELAFTGRDFDATYAEKVGLVNRLSAPGAAAVYESANSLAQEIAANPPLAVSGTKAVLAANDGKTIDEGLQFVANWNSLYLRSNDLTEAMTAFLEKRSPRFAGN